MVSADLPVAVIGCGGMGAFTRPAVRAALPPGWLPLAHAEAVAATAGLKLVGVCDPDPAARGRAAAHYGVPGFAGHDEMLAELRPAIATVATRTGPRAEILADCARRGVKGLHAEKPLCRSLAEAGAIAAALAAADVGFTFGTLRRYHAAYRRAAELLADGAIGELRQTVVGFGRRTAMWTHVHSIDAMLFFARGARARFAQGRIAVEPASVSLGGGVYAIDADPTIETGYVAFDDGTSGLVAQLDGFDVLLAGTAGTMRIAADGARIDIDRAGPASGGYLTVSTTEPTPTTTSGTVCALETLRDGIRSGRPDRGALDAAIDGQRILFALLISGLRAGAPVAPDEVPDAMTVTGRSGQLYA